MLELPNDWKKVKPFLNSFRVLMPDEPKDGWIYLSQGGYDTDPRELYEIPECWPVWIEAMSWALSSGLWSSLAIETQQVMQLNWAVVDGWAMWCQIGEEKTFAEKVPYDANPEFK